MFQNRDLKQMYVYLYRRLYIYKVQETCMQSYSSFAYEIFYIPICGEYTEFCNTCTLINFINVLRQPRNIIADYNNPPHKTDTNYVYDRVRALSVNDK